MRTAHFVSVVMLLKLAPAPLNQVKKSPMVECDEDARVVVSDAWLWGWCHMGRADGRKKMADDI